ncbi:MAG: MbnP family copper-binding protein [Pseudomonadota bacterium]
MSCTPPTDNVMVSFVARFDGEPVSCQSQPHAVTDLRFYLSDITLISREGKLAPVDLDVDERWQSSAVAMIDLEDGANACTNGTADTYAAVRGTAAKGDYSGLAFTVGVPFELNHQDPLAADAPLGDPDMHWHWRGGYKFIRAGVTDGERTFWLHLGSTGCEGTIQNITGCSAPNRMHVEFPDFDVANDRVAIDVSTLLALAVDEGVTSCSSGPAEAACEATFTALGINTNAAQRLFQVESQP